MLATQSNCAGKSPPDPSWRLLWSGHRPGDTKERHCLFAR